MPEVRHYDVDVTITATITDQHGAVTRIATTAKTTSSRVVLGDYPVAGAVKRGLDRACDEINNLSEALDEGRRRET